MDPEPPTIESVDASSEAAPPEYPHAHLQSKDFEEFELALVRAFGSWPLLERLTQIGLGVTLNTAIPTVDSTITIAVSKLVEWARVTPGIGLRRLLEAARRQNPSNPELRVIEEKWASIDVDAVPDCPYPGMSRFQENDRFEFCGRTSEIGEGLDKIGIYPFLAVIGPSGSGKSSLAFKAIVPALRKKMESEGASLAVYSIRPGSAPLNALAQIVNCEDTAQDKLIAHVKALSHATPVLLVVDQFEEVFLEDSQNTGRNQAVEFQEAIARLVHLTCVFVIITVRSDFYSSLIESPLWDEVRKNRLEVDSLKGDSLRDAIVKPAQSVGVKIENDLVQELLHDAADQPGVLPFLQAALVMLWNEAARFRIGLDAYHKLADPKTGRSGLQVAMARRAEFCYEELTSEEQTLAKNTFLRLVQFGQGRPDTRRQRSEADLCPSPELERSFDTALAKLINGRLLTADGDRAEPQRRIDIAHEALLKGWPRLAGWIAAARTAEQSRRRLSEKADEWIELGKGNGGLLDEVELQGAVQWAQGAEAQQVVVDAKIADLINASGADIERERNEKREQKEREAKQKEREVKLLRERNSRQRMLLIASALFSVLLVVLLFQLAAQQRELTAQLAQSRSREVAAVASNMLDAGDAQQALMLGLIADYGITRTAQAEETLLGAVDAWRGVGSLVGHTASVSGLFFSRDDRYLITASADRTARVWDWRTRKLLWTLTGHNDGLTAAVMSIDNKYIITASKDDGLVRIWRMSDGQLVHELKHDDKVRSIGLHPNGKWLGVRSGPNVVLWDIATGQPVGLKSYTVPSGAQLRVLAWTADGTQMLVGADDNLAHIIDIASGQQGVLNLDGGKGHQSAVISVQQSPNRRFIASMSNDLLELWQWMDSKGKFEYVDMPDARNSEGYRVQLQFSPDSRYLAAGSANGKVRIWDMRNLAAPPIQLTGHTQEINGLNFSPDGKTMVTGSRDGTVLLWNLVTQAPTVIVRTQSGNVSAPVFDRKGDVVATSDNSGAVHLWRVNLGGNIGAYYPASVPAQVLAAKDSTVFIAGENGLLEEWDTANATAGAVDLGDARLTALALMPDGRTAVGDEYGTVTVVNVDRSPVMTWSAHSGAVSALVALPDGKLASAGGDTAVKIWDASTGTAAAVLKGHANNVRALAADPLQDAVWSAGADGLVIEHRIGIEQTRVFTAGVPLISLAISPDGAYIAAGDVESRIQLWDLKDGSYWTQKATKPIRSMLFQSPGRLVTGDETGQVQFWDVAARTSATLQAHPERRTVRDLELLDDGKLLASLGDDGQVKVWPITDDDLRRLACQRADGNLTKQEWDDLFAFPADLDVCSSVPQVGSEPLQMLQNVTLTENLVSDGLPLIYSFEAVSGTVVDPGAPVLLRWNTQNAPKGVYISINGDEPQPQGSPGQRSYTFTEDGFLRLIARNDIGEQTLDVPIDVRGSPPGE